MSKTTKTYQKGVGSKELRYESTPKKLSTNQLNPNTLTCQNTGESLKTNPRFATNIVVPTPIYNMRVTID